MTRLQCLGMVLAGGWMAFAPPVIDAADRPNIVFILADDQRHTSLGCAGHPQIKTPVIDRLAGEGVRFENAFVTTPICMASRACLFTGLHGTTHGFKGRMGHPGGLVSREDVQSSFPTRLRQAGYRTGFFGKQHVKFERGVNGMEIMFDEFQAMSRNPYLKPLPDGSRRHVDEIMGDRSVLFLYSQPKDTPFFLYMSFNLAHAEDRDRRPGYHFQWPLAEEGRFDDIEPLRPRLGDPGYFEAAPEFLQQSLNRERYFWRWDTEEKYRINMRAYYRMLAGLDRIIGRIRTALEEVGMADNTVIIYNADNGYYMGDRGFAGKWSHYEESLRVPLIVYDPRMAPALRGRVLEQLVIGQDITSTILDLAGVPVPEKYQGASLTPLLHNRASLSWRSDFFCEHHVGHERIPKWIGVRDQRYTYAHYYEEEVELLYDRFKDPTQRTDLSSDPSYLNVMVQLRQRSRDYLSRYSPVPDSRKPTP